MDTDLTDNFQTGLLHIRAKLNQTAKAVRLKTTLTSPNGKTIANHTFDLPAQGLDNTIKVPSVRSWDAEHPNLYNLTLVLTEDGKEVVR